MRTEKKSKSIIPKRIRLYEKGPQPMIVLQYMLIFSRNEQSDVRRGFISSDESSRTPVEKSQRDVSPIVTDTRTSMVEIETARNVQSDQETGLEQRSQIQEDQQNAS